MCESQTCCRSLTSATVVVFLFIKGKIHREMRENPSRTGNVTRTWKATIVQNRREPACMKLHTTKAPKESKPKQKIFVILCDTIQTYTDIYRPYRKRSISRWCSTCFHFGLFCYQALGYKRRLWIWSQCCAFLRNTCANPTSLHHLHRNISQLDWINLRHRCNMTEKKGLAFANLRPMIPGGMAAWRQWIYHTVSAQYLQIMAPNACC
jgi:hypothetical protein